MMSETVAVDVHAVLEMLLPQRLDEYGLL